MVPLILALHILPKQHGIACRNKWTHNLKISFAKFQQTNIQCYRIHSYDYYVCTMCTSLYLHQTTVNQMAQIYILCTVCTIIHHRNLFLFVSYKLSQFNFCWMYAWYETFMCYLNAMQIGMNVTSERQRKKRSTGKMKKKHLYTELFA